MIDVGRRAFVGGAVGIAGLSAFSLRPLMRAASENQIPSTPGRPVAIFDERFMLARQFGEASARHDMSTVPISGDITRLWSNAHQGGWAIGESWFAGVTTPAALFGLEQLASSFWMRAAIRVDIAPRGAAGDHATDPVGFAAALHREVRNAHWTSPGLAGIRRSGKLRSDPDSLVAWVITRRFGKGVL